MNHEDTETQREPVQDEGLLINFKISLAEDASKLILHSCGAGFPACFFRVFPVAG
ncbi:MAG: hypothetical protein FJY85_05690 [Deltaproteobacteria bacterium]|nr:hypothetical protein [Deltaproteobacteria bacterium]